MTTRPTWLDDNWAMVPIAPKPRSRKIDMLAAEPCDDPAADELKEYVRQLESERDNLQNALDSMSFTCDILARHRKLVDEHKKTKEAAIKQ